MKEERYCVTCANWIPTEPVPPVRQTTSSSTIGDLSPLRSTTPRSYQRDQQKDNGVWPTTRAEDVCGDWYYGGLRFQPSIRARRSLKTELSWPQRHPAEDLPRRLDRRTASSCDARNSYITRPQPVNFRRSETVGQAGKQAPFWFLKTRNLYKPLYSKH